MVRLTSHHMELNKSNIDWSSRGSTNHVEKFVHQAHLHSLIHDVNVRRT